MNKLTEYIHHEHQLLIPHLDTLRITADAVGEVPVETLRDLTGACLGFLLRELIPHAHKEDEVLYKAIDDLLHAPGATATMSRDHVEISRFTDELSELHGGLVAGHRVTEQVARDLKRILYGLHAMASLHFAKEEEVYGTLLNSKLDIDQQESLLQRMNHS